MKRIKRLLSLTLAAVTLTGCLCTAPAFAADVDTDQTLRIGLYYDSTALTEAKLENVDVAGYSIGYYNGMTFTPVQSVSQSQLTIKIVNNAFEVSDTSTGAVLYASKAEADNLAIRPNSELTWCKGFKWNGDFVYRNASNGKIAVINYVGVEDYVKGVIPYEVNVSWPSEALKAQAVCARSYALGTLNKHASFGFDLCNTTNCQVYKGANLATSASDKAVDDTKGEYLTYNGNLIVGYFFSSDGGATEDAVNVWGGDYPYLKGKVDPYEDVDNAYNGKWSVTLTAAEIKTKLIDAGYSIGDVVKVEVTKRTATDNVNEVTVTDKDGKTAIISKAACRSVFGVNSIRYTITPNTAKTEQTKLVRTANKISASTHKVTMDGTAVAPQGYNINDNNYYKLRDIATILNGKTHQFNVAWDAQNDQILLTGNSAYQSVGGELTKADTVQVEYYAPSSSKIVLDGTPISLSGYRVNGNNYYKLRDIAAAIGFGVDFDTATETVVMTSGTPTTPEIPGDETVPTAYTFDGTGWGHSVGLSQYGALAMAQKGHTYDEILKFYYTGITIKQ